jgi:glycosyltransferase involved in cell wall biosynthesis
MISVIMPIFNADKDLLQKSIESILAQTYENFEFIIVDDGSEIEYSLPSDERIKYFKRKHEGIVSALNFGFEKAKGEYFARQDADDISVSDRLEKQLSYMEKHKETDLLFSFASVNGKDYKFPPIVNINLLRNRNFLVHGTVFSRIKFRYENDYEKAEDYHLWCKLLLEGKKINVLPEILYHYIYNGSDEVQNESRDEIIKWLDETLPVISVVMPVYNTDPSFLQEAIFSILAQTYENFEFIIVDDGSEIEYSLPSDEKIKYFKRKHEGISAARNYGLDVAAGKYIAVMDADDISYPERFEKELSFLEANPAYMCVGSNALRNGIPTNHKTTNEEIKAKLRKEFSFCHSSILYRNCFLRYDTTLSCCVDYDFFRRMSLYKDGMYNLKETLVWYRVHDKQISFLKKKEQLENKKLISDKYLIKQVFHLLIKNKHKSGVLSMLENLEGKIIPFEISDETKLGKEITIDYDDIYLLEEYPEIFAKHIFKFGVDEKTILHIHTLNLGNIALFLKKMTGCKIVTHLHCMPYRCFYDVNIDQYNKLQNYVNLGVYEKTLLLTKNDNDLFVGSDEIITVSKDGEFFLKNLGFKSTLIPNAIKPFRIERSPVKNTAVWVGNGNKSKGYELAIEIAKQTGIILKLIGNIPPHIQMLYNYPNIIFLGELEKEQVLEEYSKAEFGLITSKFEQCSIVALEMTMVELPVIALQAKGIEEQFDNCSNENNIAESVRRRNYSIPKYVNTLEKMKASISALY